MVTLHSIGDAAGFYVTDHSTGNPIDP